MVDKEKLAEARRLAEARDYVSTERLVREMREQDPDDLVLLDLHGYALYFLGRNDDAESVCRRTLELSPDHAYASKGLGLCLAKREGSTKRRRPWSGRSSSSPSGSIPTGTFRCLWWLLAGSALSSTSCVGRDRPCRSAQRIGTGWNGTHAPRVRVPGEQRPRGR